jgi:hypothetical protein
VQNISDEEAFDVLRSASHNLNVTPTKIMNMVAATGFLG